MVLLFSTNAQIIFSFFVLHYSCRYTFIFAEDPALSMASNLLLFGQAEIVRVPP